MSDIALRYRKRAEECRRLATDARTDGERTTLIKMANELEEGAYLIDREVERANQTRNNF